MGQLQLLLVFSLLATTLNSSSAFPSLSSIKSINEFNNAIAATFYQAHKLSLSQRESINKLDVFLNDTYLVLQHLTSHHPIMLSDSMQEALNPLITAIGNYRDFEKKTANLVDSFKQFDTYFVQFVNLVTSDTTEEVIKNFVSEIVDDQKNKLEDAINNIYNAMTSGTLENIFSTLSDYLQKFNQIFEEHQRCDFAMPVQDSIKNVYDLVAVNEIRGLAMNIFALNYRQVTSEDANEKIISEKISSFMNRMSRILKDSRVLIANASVDLIRCDPDEFVLDENCFRLEDLFTKYFVNERQLSDTNNVNFKYFLSYNRIECLDETSNDQLLLKYYCPSRQCNGKLHDCRQVTPMSAFCESPESSGPRYLWAVDEYNSSHIDECLGEFVDTMTQSTHKSLMCQCSEEGAESEATRAINMNPQMANINDNMVVANVRFLKKDNMIHLQIEQGALLPEGKIDPDTVEIVPVGRFRYLKNRNNGSFVMISPDDPDDEIYLTYDSNYTFVSHDHNVFHLDEINVDRGYVVTGVRLRNSEFNPKDGINTSPIELQVHATLFDYHRGVLLVNGTKTSKGSMWITPKNLDNRPGYTSGRELLDLSNLGDSMTGEYVNVVDSLPNQEIEFQPSAVGGNLGQTTIPYFDSRPPVENGLRALKGVGIIHRGADGAGGFLAPKIMAVDYKEYMYATVGAKDMRKWPKEWMK